MKASNSWRPSASLSALRARAELIADVRVFFAERGVLEVETPTLCHAAVTDPAIASLHTTLGRTGETLYLQTSPEYAMKRLLAAGTGAIFQICKAFRDDEQGDLHQPEFTMLEWYRPDFDLFALMDEVDALLMQVLACDRSSRHTYRSAFERYAGIDPLSARSDELSGHCLARGLSPAAAETLERNALLDYLLTHCVLPALGDGLHCVYDFPAEQAALARVRAGEPPLAERFEFYFAQVELANGYAELTDAVELERRMQADTMTRARRNLPDVPPDTRLLDAHHEGLPACAGVALGIDRVVMLATGHRSLDDVIAFPAARA